ncbi:MAG: hypothetical protein JZU47_09955 [Prolixibacteraceae bacterium]|nr:hypothetical protein [Prolixibacteraceae bacterium]
MGYDLNHENDGISQLSGRNTKRSAQSTVAGLTVQTDQQIIRRQNELIQKWTPKVRSALRSSARWFSDGKFESAVLRHGGKQLEKKLASSINSKVGKDLGLANYVGFQFERHGVFVHKGVGRGYQSNGLGFVRRTAINPPRGQQRIAVEWFNPVLDKYLPELADGIAEINADAAVNTIKMRIV